MSTSLKTGTVSVVIAVRDEETMLPGCLERLGFANEVVVILDDRTTDRSNDIAEAWGATVVSHRFTSFAAAKNLGIDRATGHWVLIVDADERISARLAAEIDRVVSETRDAYRAPIANYFYGRQMSHGGWSEERPVRLWRRGSGRYEGRIHEVVKLTEGCEVGELINPIVHFSHRSVLDNLRKTAEYADLEARAMLAEGSAPVTPSTLVRVAARELLRRLVRRRAWRDGMPGWIEALYQPLSLLAVRARLWELQQEPSVAERYRLLEEELA